MAGEVNKFTKPEDLPAFLTIREVAEYMGASYATVRKHIASGRIPSRELGNRSFVPREFFTTYQVKFEEVEKQVSKPELILVTKRWDEIEKEKQEQRDREAQEEK